MKGQVPPPGASSFSGGGGSNVRFNPRNAEDIFAEFFGDSSPFGGMGGFGMGTRGSRFHDSMFGGFGGPESMFEGLKYVRRIWWRSYYGTSESQACGKQATMHVGRAL